MHGAIAYRNIHLRSIPHTQQKKNGAIWFRGRQEPSVNMRGDQRPKNGRRQWKWAYFGGPPPALTVPAMPRAAGVFNKGPSGLHKRAHCVVLCTFTVKPIFWKVVNSTSRKSGSVAEGRVKNECCRYLTNSAKYTRWSELWGGNSPCRRPCGLLVSISYRQKWCLQC